MAAYRLTSAASRDVFGIYVQGHDLFGPRQAQAYNDELKDLFLRLATNPRLTRLRKELDPAVFAYPYKAHVVIYELDPSGTVVVLRIRHGHEDWVANPMGDSDR